MHKTWFFKNLPMAFLCYRTTPILLRVFQDQLWPPPFICLSPLPMCTLCSWLGSWVLWFPNLCCVYLEYTCFFFTQLSPYSLGLFILQDLAQNSTSSRKPPLTFSLRSLVFSLICLLRLSPFSFGFWHHLTGVQLSRYRFACFLIYEELQGRLCPL